MKKYFLGLALIMFVFCGNVFASELFKTIGSRVMGLGGAFTGVANDANAVFINPAGLLQLRGSFVDMGYNMSSDKNFYSGHMSFANSSPLDNEAGGMGFYTKGNNVSQGKDRQYIVLISVAQPYGKNFYFGGSAKYIKNTNKFNEIDVPSTKESAFSFDLGMFFKLHESVSFGIMGYDLGKPDISTNSRKVTMGMGLKLGTAANVGFDVDHFAQKDARQLDYHAGVDFLPQQNVSLQLGYFTDKLNNSETVTGGLKLQVAQKDRNDYIGYAYSEELREGLDKKIEKLHSISVGLFY
ncbi:MAG: hypothetical protein ABII25_04880 [bacterium]